MCRARKAVQEMISPLAPEMNPKPMQGRRIHKRSLSVTPNSPSKRKKTKRKKTKRTPASMSARCSSRSRPSLQDLPVELLEIIFLYSMNLALPRSSPLLGAKLSGKATLSRVFMAAFHGIWKSSLSMCEGAQEEFHPEWEEWSEPDDEELEEEAYTQFALVSMPWANIDFILDVQQVWADKYARGRFFDHDEDRGNFYCPGWEISYTPRFHQHLIQHSLGEMTFDARACFEADYDRALALPFSPDEFSEATLSGLPQLTFPVVPMNLITGPWDEEKKRRLFWLARANLDYVSNTFDLGPRAVEVKLACLDSAAISTENLDPLIANCLMGSDSWFFEDLPDDARHKRLDKLVERIDRGGEEVDMDILRFVVTQLDYEGCLVEYHFPRDDEL
ncbi:hypothetical protein E4U13_001405 [Claviceps humidiphila]|uniref:Uncharacterized protein n=1 Tax=Claviceps humidiphila TaxID=1294629 RepID=A0A9P7Q5Q7_9HYPO|nr:hypothetical protein E4U13_001405 [Claviceps humidiphila]